MRKKGRQHKEVIRNRVISLRLNDEEFLRLKANALRDKSSVSEMVRARMTELTGWQPARGEIPTKEANR